MGAVHPLEHPHHARHADREPADRHIRPGARRAVRRQEQALVDGGRRGLASVVALHDPPRGVPVEQEAAAADAGRLRLDQPEDHLRGDGRVDGVSARFENARACLRRCRVRRRDHRVLGTGRHVGRERLRGHARGRQRENEQRGAFSRATRAIARENPPA